MWALAVAAGAAHRLPCAARQQGVLQNSLRSLCSTKLKQAAAEVITKRAARAALLTALLSATDSAPTGHRLPLNQERWRSWVRHRRCQSG